MANSRTVGTPSRRKGPRVEIEVAHTLQRFGIPATKRSGMYIPGHDIDARAGVSDARVGKKKRTLRSNKETDDGKRCATLLKLLD
jgi:hypothetical protein